MGSNTSTEMIKLQKTIKEPYICFMSCLKADIAF